MDETRPFSHRRLQREKDFTGERIATFRAVFLRHGLPGIILALVCFTIPDLQLVFLESVEKALANPGRYLAIGLLIFAGLNAYAWFIDRQWSPAKLGWIVYLGALSFWEEWVFRVALPHSLEGFGLPVWSTVILSAMVFGGAHYFTLRWRWQWCVGAFIGALFLSRQMNLHQDLLLITAFHWIGTYLNTPRPPGESSRAGLIRPQAAGDQNP
ncbi:MAG: CPBP family intramembrane glutamic endopeptidase [Pseudomonadota bacterium]